MGRSYRRNPIPNRLRAELLIANQHACCICGKSNIQIHHLNGDPADNRRDNLAVLCIEHHAQATAPSGMTAKLTPSHIVTYKQIWEKTCRQRAERAARSRTAFFMVDYKNVGRLQQLYSQLSYTQRSYAADRLYRDLRDESNLRREQGFDISLEPNLGWSEPLEYFLQQLKCGAVEPQIFQPSSRRKSDLERFLLSRVLRPAFLYDLWCQVVARALVICNGTYNIDDLMQLEDPRCLRMGGALISCEGRTRGTVYEPALSKTHSCSTIMYQVTGERAVWSTCLTLKTKDVYSVTAAANLSNGKENGLLVFRSIDRMRLSRSDSIRVRFSATPLILGIRVIDIT